MIFYMGAFVYALLDAQKNLGDNDTSHAIALGLWYSIIVLVAIICGVISPLSVFSLAVLF